MTVRTRFAPSPTGYLHIGGARTALFAWLFARHHDGEFVLRIEDTDLERSTEQSVKVIADGLSWLGLDVDKGPIFQSDRVDRYKELLEQLTVRTRRVCLWHLHQSRVMPQVKHWFGVQNALAAMRPARLRTVRELQT